MTRPLFVLLLGAFGIACAAIFVRLALPAPPIVTGFWRLALATGVLAAVLTPRVRLRALPRRAVVEALAAGACFGADLALWNTALVETSVATATFLVNTTPAFVGLFAVLALRERLEARLLAGFALALAGVVLLLGDDLDASASLAGDGLALGAALFYSAYLLWIQRARRSLDTATSVAVSGAASTLVLAAAALWRGDPFTGFPPHSWAVFAASATISHLAGVVGIVWGARAPARDLRRRRPARAARRHRAARLVVARRGALAAPARRGSPGARGDRGGEPGAGAAGGGRAGLTPSWRSVAAGTAFEGREAVESSPPTDGVFVFFRGHFTADGPLHGTTPSRLSPVFPVCTPCGIKT